MRVVITGHNGQLGRQLVTAFEECEQCHCDLPAHDVGDPKIVDRIVSFKPDLILHAAAYTNVDGAEKDPELAYRVNTLGTQYVALASKVADAAMVHISTNEVFDGTQREAYREWEAINPISVYARTKAAAERIVLALAPKPYIVRVAWLFGPGKNNFVTKILTAAEKTGGLEVAADEFGNPTYAADVAQAILKLAKTGYYGIYHLPNAGFCSRFDFAREILRLAGKSDVPIKPILSADWPRPSIPPLHAVLLNSTGAALGVTLRSWQAALAEYVPTVKTTG